MSVLSEVGEFVRSLIEIAKTAPPDKLAVFVVGLLGLGGIGGYFYGKSRRPPPPPGPQPPPPDPNDDRPKELDEAQPEIARLKEQMKANQEVIDAMLGSEGEIWRLYDPDPPPDPSIRRSRTRIVVIANNKGGVGKTTLTVYLAAYFRSQGKRVLVVDLDYQGSCTKFMLQAGGISIPDNQPEKLRRANLLLSGEPLMEWPAETLRDGPLAGIQLITADYSLTDHETKLQLYWLANGGRPDVRYRLAQVLRGPYVQRQSGESTSGFDVVLIDAPPRFTPGTINALVASTHLIVPTILDPLSAETVASFLQQAWTLREHMNLDIELAGIVGTMTPAQPLANDLREVQQAALAIVRTGLLQWHGDTHIFDRDIQDLAAIDRTAGQQVIYSEQNNKVFQMFTELGKQVCGRIRL